MAYAYLTTGPVTLRQKLLRHLWGARHDAVGGRASSGVGPTGRPAARRPGWSLYIGSSAVPRLYRHGRGPAAPSTSAAARLRECGLPWRSTPLCRPPTVTTCGAGDPHCAPLTRCPASRCRRVRSLSSSTGDVVRARAFAAAGGRSRSASPPARREVAAPSVCAPRLLQCHGASGAPTTERQDVAAAFASRANRCAGPRVPTSRRAPARRGESIATGSRRREARLCVPAPTPTVGARHHVLSLGGRRPFGCDFPRRSRARRGGDRRDRRRWSRRTGPRRRARRSALSRPYPPQVPPPPALRRRRHRRAAAVRALPRQEVREWTPSLHAGPARRHSPRRCSTCRRRRSRRCLRARTARLAALRRAAARQGVVCRLSVRGGPSHGPPNAPPSSCRSRYPLADARLYERGDFCRRSTRSRRAPRLLHRAHTYNYWLEGPTFARRAVPHCTCRPRARVLGIHDRTLSARRRADRPRAHPSGPSPSSPSSRIVGAGHYLPTTPPPPRALVHSSTGCRARSTARARPCGSAATSHHDGSGWHGPPTPASAARSARLRAVDGPGATPDPPAAFAASREVHPTLLQRLYLGSSRKLVPALRALYTRRSPRPEPRTTLRIRRDVPIPAAPRRTRPDRGCGARLGARRRHPRARSSPCT